jgi:hypothetical protein
VEYRGDAIVAVVVGNAAQDSDRGTTAALPEDDPGGGELVAECVPGDDRAAPGGQEVVGGVVQDQLDDLGGLGGLCRDAQCLGAWG